MIPCCMGSKSNWQAYMALFAVYFFWGTTYLGIRMALEAVPPGSPDRHAISASPVASCLSRRNLSARSFREAANSGLQRSFGLIALGGGNGTLVFSEQWIPSGIAALFVTTSPFWMVGIEALAARGEADEGDRDRDCDWISRHPGP